MSLPIVNNLSEIYTLSLWKGIIKAEPHNRTPYRIVIFVGDMFFHVNRKSKNFRCASVYLDENSPYYKNIVYQNYTTEDELFNFLLTTELKEI